jgi:hypothetical protein
VNINYICAINNKLKQSIPLVLSPSSWLFWESSFPASEPRFPATKSSPGRRIPWSDGPPNWNSRVCDWRGCLPSLPLCKTRGYRRPCYYTFNAFWGPCTWLPTLFNSWHNLIV